MNISMVKGERNDATIAIFLPFIVEVEERVSFTGMLFHSLEYSSWHVCGARNADR